MRGEANMPLAIEPLHPAYAADRACVNTTKQALDICDRLDPERSGALGVALDVYHIWWDPELLAQIARAGKDRLLAFHVCDWLVPTKDILNDRGMMGDGVIDIRSVRARGRGARVCRLFRDRDFFQRLVGEADGRGLAHLHRAAPDGGVRAKTGGLSLGLDDIRLVSAKVGRDLRLRHMARRTGSADLPLHGGRVPPWLATRMSSLGAIIAQAIVHHYGRDEFLQRLSHPFWFQSLWPRDGDGLAFVRHHDQRNRRVEARA